MPQKTNQEKRAEWDAVKSKAMENIVGRFMVKEIEDLRKEVHSQIKEVDKWRTEAQNLQEKLNNLNYVEDLEGDYGKEETPLCGTGPNPYRKTELLDRKTELREIFKKYKDHEIPKELLNEYDQIIDTEKAQRLKNTFNELKTCIEKEQPITIDLIGRYNDLVCPTDDEGYCKETDFMP